MKSFEKGISPSGQRPAPKKEVAPSLKAFDSEKALEKERGILERFGGKAKHIARVMLVVSVLTSGPLLARKAYAEEGQARSKTEEVEHEKQNLEIDKAKLTESSQWSGGIVESARKDLVKIKTADDAEWLVRSYFNKFVSEYYLPTKGDLKEGPYGIKSRQYTLDDLKFLLKNARELKKILRGLNEKFGITAYQNRMEQINDIIYKTEGQLEEQSSYAGQKEKESLEQLEKYLEGR
jgi:cell division protein FtsL